MTNSLLKPGRETTDLKSQNAKRLQESGSHLNVKHDDIDSSDDGGVGKKAGAIESGPVRAGSRTRSLQ